MNKHVIRRVGLSIVSYLREIRCVGPTAALHNTVYIGPNISLPLQQTRVCWRGNVVHSPHVIDSKRTKLEFYQDDDVHEVEDM